ncbi:MAG: nucleotidyltransferase domain-containing protein [Anaerolineae bacterium]
MNSKPDHLQRHEWSALEAYVAGLLSRHRQKVAEVWLFGSKARGDFTSDSDLDVLIVLIEQDSQLRDEVRLIAARVSLEYDVLINTHVINCERWAALHRERAPYWQNVQRDGVLLLQAGVA